MATVVPPNPYENTSPDDRMRWIMLYPAYINARKSIVEGRRIRKDLAVDTPTCSEIKDVCTSLGINAEVEANRVYPREQARDTLHTGRVRIQLLDKDGNPVHSELLNKKQLFLKVCQLIPKLKTRQSKGGGAEGGGGGGGGNKKKKGKGR